MIMVTVTYAFLITLFVRVCVCVWYLALLGGTGRAEDSSVRYAPTAAQTEGPEGNGTETDLGEAAVELGLLKSATFKCFLE